MRYCLAPGPLSLPIEYDDNQHKLTVNSRLVPLSYKQYELVMALLRQRQRWLEAPGQVPVILSSQRLQKVGKIGNRLLLQRHLCDAASRLAAIGLHIVCLHGWGYAVFSSAELDEELACPVGPNSSVS